MERQASIIHRALQRIADDAHYDPKLAHRRILTRCHGASSRVRIDVVAWEVVEARLRDDWSSKQIAGSQDIEIRVERICQYITANRQQGGDQWKHLRCRKHRRRHCYATPRQRRRFGCKRIQEPPTAVDKRSRVGDWGSDTVVGTGQARLITLAERKSGPACIRSVSKGKSQKVRCAIIEDVYPLHQGVYAPTRAGGSDFAGHLLMDIALNSSSYFAASYSSRQRGCSRARDGVVR